MDKEQIWFKKRLGRITASELNDVVSLSGAWVEANVDYIRHKRFERARGFRLPINGRALNIGKEQEKYAIAWLREQNKDLKIMYSQELPEIPIWEADWGNFAASPDAFLEDESVVFEIKTLVGNSQIEFFSDEHTPYADKCKVVFKEHGNQLAGQFLSNPKVKEIVLIKYIPQLEDVDEDTDSPLAPWRGICFAFKREDFDLGVVKTKILDMDAWISSSLPPSYIKRDWVREGDKIVMIDKKDANNKAK